MQIKAKSLLITVIKPVCHHLSRAFEDSKKRDLMDSASIHDLLLGTAAKESHLGKYLIQVNGIALGPWQIEPATHDDCCRYLKNKSNLKDITYNLLFGISSKDQLIWNVFYSCAIARIKYWMIPAPLPQENAYLTKEQYIHALGEYWDKWYNCNPKHGNAREFVECWEKYVE